MMLKLSRLPLRSFVGITQRGCRTACTLSSLPSPKASSSYRRGVLWMCRGESSSSSVVQASADSVREHFSSDRVTWDSFVKTLVSSNLVSDGSATNISSVVGKLERQGALLRVQDSGEPRLDNSVFLHPERVEQVLNRAFDVDATHVRTYVSNLETELLHMKREHADMMVRKNQIDASARRSASLWLNTGLLYLISQTAVLAHLTYEVYAWDVTEPICFFASSIPFFIGYIFYVKTKTDLSLVSMREYFTRKKQLKLFRRRKFNEERFLELEKSIGVTEDLIRTLRTEYQISP